MDNQEFNYLITELRRKENEFAEAMDLDGMSVVDEEISRLTDWFKAGQVGDMPDGYQKFGIKLPSHPDLLGMSSQLDTTRQTVKKAEFDAAQETSLEAEVDAAVTLTLDNQVWTDTSTGQNITLDNQLGSIPPEGSDDEQTTDEESEQGVREASTLNQMISDGQQLLKDGKYREAIGIAHAVMGRAAEFPRVLERAIDLKDRAQGELNTQITHYLDAGDAARGEGNDAIARKNYQKVLELDPENAHARHALLDLDHLLVEQLSLDQQKSLLRALRDWKHLTRLGEAVYEAEALNIEGKLTNELAEALSEARPEYDRLRELGGQLTTAMRFGDLMARATARDRLAELVVKEHSEIYDQTLNTNRPSYEILEEASMRLIEQSKDTAQYEIDRANRLIATHPIAAKQILTDALSLPFFETDRNALRVKLDDIDVQISKLETAERKLVEAGHQGDPIASLKLTLEAIAAFPNLVGLEQRLSGARITACDTLIAEIQSHHSEAINKLQLEDFSGAKNELKAARLTAAQWPEEPLPGEITLILQTNETINQEIDQRQSERNEFNNLQDQILDLVADPNRRAAGLALLAQLNQDSRFARFPDRSVLNSLTDQYKGLTDQLMEAEIARTEGNWLRVKELAVAMKTSGQAGQFIDRIDELFNEANTELDIQKARQHLENDEIREANKILSRLVPYGPSELSNPSPLAQRLSVEISRAQQAIKDSRPFQDMYNQAVEWKSKNDVNLQLLALSMFRYVGGDPAEAPRQGWPEYRLSVHTSDARREARELSGRLRGSLLSPLISSYEQREAKPLDEITLRQYADKARFVREARLMDTESERACIRWLEVEQGHKDAAAKELIGEWEEAVRIWHDLNLNHPRIASVEAGLRNARIQQAVHQAELLVSQGQTSKALEDLRKLQQEPGLSFAWQLDLAMADTYAARAEFSNAFDCLKHAEKHNAESAILEKKRAHYQREQAIQVADSKAREFYQSGEPAEALRALISAQSEDLTKDSDRLKRFAHEIYSKTESLYLIKARQHKDTGTPEGKIEAVKILVDLRELEIVQGVPIEERRSESELQALKDEIIPVARIIADEAVNFNPATLNLDRAIEQSNIILGRLVTFKEIGSASGSVDVELSGRLDNLRLRIGKQHDNLVHLKEIITDANQTEVWKRAIEIGDFSILEERYLKQLTSLNLDNMSEIKTFTQRLVEWKMLRKMLFTDLAKIKKTFSVEEDFNEVAKNLNRLKVCYDLRSDEQPWTRISQSDYQSIYSWLSPNFRIVDDYAEGNNGSRELVGAAIVEQAAHQRQAELEHWENWDLTCYAQMLEIDNLRTKANKLDETIPLISQYQTWAEVKQMTEKLQHDFSTGPLNDGHPVSVHSGKASQIKDTWRKRGKFIQDWLSEAKHHLSEIEPGLNFPSVQEFADAVKQKDHDLLGKLLERARAVGSTDPKDIQRIDMYQKAYQEMINHKTKPGFFRRRGNQ